jgi:hypothetical protein
MPWKITEENGKKTITLNDAGLPIYVYDDGEESAIDYALERNKINELNEKNNRNKTVKETLDTLFVLLGVSDSEGAKKFVAKAKEDAALAEDARSGNGKKASEELSLANAKIEKLESTIKDKEVVIVGLNGQIDRHKITSTFASSSFVSEKLVNAIMAEKLFGERFKIENGQVIGYDEAGNKILNDKGDPDFNLAIEKIVNASPFKDSVIKSTTFPGGGSGGGKSYAGGGDLSKMTETELTELLGAHPEMKEAVNAEFKRRVANMRVK